MTRSSNSFPSSKSGSQSVFDENPEIIDSPPESPSVSVVVPCNHYRVRVSVCVPKGGKLCAGGFTRNIYEIGKGNDLN